MNIVETSTEYAVDELVESDETTLKGNTMFVPGSIRDEDRWIAYREEIENKDGEGKVKKVPTLPNVETTQEVGRLIDVSPKTREDAVSFEEALDFAIWTRKQDEIDDVDGVGLVIREDDDLTLVDLDCVISDGTLAPWAESIVTQLDSYTELSPSGDGLHILVRGGLSKLSNDNQRNPEGKQGEIEMYDNARFATFTGRRIDDTPETIKCRPNTVEDVHLEYVDDPATDGDLPDGVSEEDLDVKPSQQGAIKTLGPANRNLVRRARRADDDFDALWGGDTSLYSRDNSRADFALLCKLAWWTKSDLSRMERIFRASGLMRQKFDRELADTTYGLYSARKAIRKNGQ